MFGKWQPRQDQIEEEKWGICLDSLLFPTPWGATVAEEGTEAKLVPGGGGGGEPVCDKWVQLDHGMDFGKPGL